MPRATLNDLTAFLATAEARSFSRAAKKLGVSPSALSHALRALEERLDVRLLTRTTRSVSTTEAGERLLAILRPAMADIDAALTTLRSERDTPAGTVRITAVKHAVETLIRPMLPAFTARYPDIRLEIDVADRLTEIVSSGYDAGIRFSGSIDKDMIAFHLGPDMAAAVVAAPAYLSGRDYPREPKDCAEHRCIVHSRPGGGAYAWPFREGERTYQLRVDGALVFNDSDLVLDAALAGQGLAYVFAERAAPHVARGALVQLFGDQVVPVPGYDLYYPSRRQTPPALAAFIAALRTACIV